MVYKIQGKIRGGRLYACDVLRVCENESIIRVCDNKGAGVLWKRKLGIYIQFRLNAIEPSGHWSHGPKELLLLW